MLDNSNSLRLARRVAEMIPCSRSEAERYVAGGWISVDGAVVEEPGARVEDHQVVTLQPDAKPDEIVPVTLLLHRPAGVAEPLDCVTRESWLPAGPGAQRFLKRHRRRLTNASPLELEASGLVVLTQDFSVARKLVDDGVRVEQEYNVEVSGELCEKGLALLNHGLAFHGKEIPPMKVSWQSENRLRFALKGVQPGQLTHLCQLVNLKVVSIKRIRIGRVSMARLPAGHWRFLHESERF